MSNNLVDTPSQKAADTPQPVPTLTPEQVVDMLRTMRAQIAEVAPLTAEQRKQLRNRTNLPAPVVMASINVMGASDGIAQAVGQPAGVVRQMVDESNRWTAVEDEMRASLNGVSGANLRRRQKIALIAAQAYNIGKQLARDPENAALVPHVAEVKRLRSLASRKKRTSQAPETPSPEPVTPQAADAPEPSKT
jgi:hypothetical protein